MGPLSVGSGFFYASEWWQWLGQLSDEDEKSLDHLRPLAIRHSSVKSLIKTPEAEKL